MLGKFTHDHQWIIEAKWLFSWNSFSGFSGFPFLILVEDIQDGYTVRHELAHAYQKGQGLWLGFYARYIYELIYYGYENTPLEVSARMYSRGAITLEEVW